ncbi:MAG: cellulase family glycosylhydrolase [Armatimonadota bacterium]|nr:cellulase family glycosylhydrolase [Armatimonadota bacterium]
MRTRTLICTCAVVMTVTGQAMELGIDGTRFTLEGEAAFLVGVSYYAGQARTPELMTGDLDDLRELGVNWVRVWATWERHGTQPALDEAGATVESAMSRLRELVRLADERGMIVDVTLHRGGVLTTQEAHLAAVRTISRELLPWRNVYIDVANERDVRDARFVSLEECRELRDAIREVDAHRLVTASCALRSAEALDEFLETTQVDLIAPHLGRGPEDPAKTRAVVTRCLAWMREIGRGVPVHLQEPFRRDYGSWQPETEDFLTDLRGAIEGGAAGWCLHNGSNRGADDGEPRRSFDLRPDRGPFLDTLDAVEREVLSRLSEVLPDGGED